MSSSQNNHKSQTQRPDPEERGGRVGVRVTVRVGVRVTVAVRVGVTFTAQFGYRLITRAAFLVCCLGLWA